MAGRSWSRPADVGGKSVALSPLGFLPSRRFSSGRPRRRCGSPACGAWRAAAASGPSRLADRLGRRAGDGLRRARQGLLYFADLSGPFRRRRRRWEAGSRARRRVGPVASRRSRPSPRRRPADPAARDFGRLLQAIGFSPRATQTENMKPPELPQYFADMFGWREMAEEVSRRLQRPAARRARQGGVLRAQLRRGRRARRLWAGAGRSAGDQRPQQLFPLGPRGFDGSVVITMSATPGVANFEERRAPSAESIAAYAMRYETNIPISILRGLRMPVAKFWPTLKHYGSRGAPAKADYWIPPPPLAFSARVRA